MSIRLVNVKQYYVGLEHQKTAVEWLGKEMIRRGFHSMGNNPFMWLNFSDDHLERVQAVVGEETLKEFTIKWHNSKETEKKVSVDWNDMNSKVSKYFTVREVTNNDPRRIPTSQEIKNNILKLASELDKVREAWGSAIICTSWYRPPAINRAVGGARYSQHLTGKAVDIYPANGKRLEFEKWLDNVAWKNKALGYGQKAGRGFTHIDLRSGKIRWQY